MNFGTLGQAQIPDLRKVLTLTAHVPFKVFPKRFLQRVPLQTFTVLLYSSMKSRIGP